MFGIGGFELFIILLFGFLIFGPDKLPEIAKTVGKGIARFRQAQDEMNDVIKSTDIYDPNSDEPFKDPMQALDKIAQRQEEKNAAKKTGQTPAAATSSSAAKPAAGTGETSASASAASPSGGARQESFTERKARYERERAARKAAEEQAAKEGGTAPSADDGAKPAEPAGSADAAPQAPEATSASGKAGDEPASAHEGGEQ